MTRISSALKKLPARKISKAGEKGSSVIEFALVAPVLLSLMLATFDAGLYAYAFISVENAARAAASRNSSGTESASDQAAACSIALSELKGLPNIAGISSGTCSSAPLQVTSILCNQSTPCSGSSTSVDGKPATAVTIRYTIPGLFRIPLAGPSVITRVCQMKVQNVS